MATQLTPVTDPKILAQLNAPESNVVTDPAVLQQLNQPVSNSEYPNLGTSSALGAFGREAVATPVNMLLNFGRLFTDPLTDPNITKAVYASRGAVAPVSQPLTASDILPSSVAPTAGDQAFPLSQLLGKIVGGGALALGTGGAGVEGGAVDAENAVPSLLGKMMSSGRSGFMQGYAYSPGDLGNRLQSGTIGGAVGAAIPAVIRGAKGIRSSVKNLAQDIKMVSNTDPADLQSAVDESQNVINSAQATHEAQQDNINNQKSAIATARFIAGGSPEATAVKIGATKAQIGTLENQLNSIQDAPDEPAIAQLFKTGSTPDMRDAQANRMVIAAKSDADAAHNDQAQDLDVGRDQNVILRNGITGDTESIKDQIRPKYQQVADELTGLRIKLPVQIGGQDISSSLQDLRDSVPPDSDVADSADDLMTALDNAKTDNDVKATDAIKIWKAARDRASNAQNKMYQSNIGEDERLQWANQYKKLNPIATKLRSTLEDELPPETLALQDQADQEWGQRVTPITQSPIFKLARTGKTLPNNLIERISGDEPQNAAMRGLILQNPALSKAALAKMYADNPKNMLQWNEASEPYIQANPKTAMLRANQLDAEDNLQRAKNIRDINANLYPEQQSVFNKRQKLAQQIQDTKTSLDQLQTAHENHLQEISKGEQENAKLQSTKQQILNAQQLQQERLNAQKDYLAKKQNIKSKIWKAVGGGMAYYALHREIWDLLNKL